jgi:hypothetical protein
MTDSILDEFDTAPLMRDPNASPRRIGNCLRVSRKNSIASRERTFRLPKWQRELLRIKAQHNRRDRKAAE